MTVASRTKVVFDAGGQAVSVLVKLGGWWMVDDGLALMCRAE